MNTARSTRQSISLPSKVAKRVKSLARARRASANRVLVDLIEKGLDARESEKREFFSLADRLASSTDARERKRLRKKLAAMTFGE